MRRFLSLFTALAVALVGIGLGSPAQAAPVSLSIDQPASAPVGSDATVTVTVEDDDPDAGPADVLIFTVDGQQVAAGASGDPLSVPIPNEGDNDFLAISGDLDQQFTITGETEEIVAANVTLNGDTSILSGDSAALQIAWATQEGEPINGNVTLQRRDGSSWVNDRTVEVDGDTGVRVSPTADTTYRVTTPDTTTALAATSNEHSVTVIDESTLADARVTLSAENDTVFTDESTNLTIGWSNSDGDKQSGNVTIQQRLGTTGEWIDAYNPDVVDGVGVVEVFPVKVMQFRAVTPATENTRRGTSAPVTVTAKAPADAAVITITGPERLQSGQSTDLSIGWENGDGVKQSGDVVLQTTNAAADFAWSDLKTVTVTDGVASTTITPADGNQFYRVLTPATDTVKEGTSEPISIEVTETRAAAVVSIDGNVYVHPGESTDLTVNWSNENGAKQSGTVVLQQSTSIFGGNWNDVDTLVVTDGKASFTSTPEQSTAYRVLTPGNETTAPGESKRRIVSVLTNKTSASVRFNVAESAVNSGQEHTGVLRWENSLTDKAQSGTVTLQYRTGANEGEWTNLKTAAVVAGDATIKFTVPANGYVRIVTPETATTKAAESFTPFVSVRVPAAAKVTGPTSVLVNREASLNVTWTGKAGSKESGRITLQYRTVGTSAWTTSGATRYVYQGAATIKVTAAKSTEYRIITPATQNAQPVTSAPFTLKVVKPSVKISTSGTKTLKKGKTGSITIKMTEQDGKAGSAVLTWQRRYPGGKWHTIGTATVGSSGVRTVSVKPSKTVYYRFVKKETANSKAATSNTHTVTVKR